MPPTTPCAADRTAGRGSPGTTTRQRDRTPARKGELDQGDKRDRFGETRTAAACEGVRHDEAEPEGVLVYAERFVTRRAGPFTHGEPAAPNRSSRCQEHVRTTLTKQTTPKSA